MSYLRDKEYTLSSGMRTEEYVNREWKFTYGDHLPAAETEVESWSDIGIPHSFGIPYFMEHEFYTGYGTYYKKLLIPEEKLNQRILLEFSGVFQVAEVFLNGELLRVHKGGYTAFIVDLTGIVKEENDLVVRVNNLWNGRIAPRAGEHQFNGGIYRDVKLIYSSKDCVDWYGTFIYTKELLGEEKDKAVLGTETTVVLTAEDVDRKVISLKTTLWDGDLVLAEETVVLEDEAKQVVKQRFQVKNITPWSPENPQLYYMTSELSVNGVVKDCFATEFGIRTTLFDPYEGFFLNGEHYYILGANVHQDHAGWVDAVSHSGIRRDVKMVKDCGMNFIRGSHYPHHTYFAERCDREGMLFWSELCYWGTGGPNVDGYWTSSAYPVKLEDEEEFEQNCLDTLDEMILTNRNHPSIIVWSMSNEPFFTEKSTMDKAKRLLRKLVARSHRLDPTRVAAAGGVQRGDFDILGDIAGYNGDGASLYHNPGFPNFVSEFGSTAEDRPGKAEARYRDGVEVDYPWRAGKSLWCAFHHGSIFGDMGHMGMIDYFRLPLNTWYWYREHLKGIPMPEARSEGVPAQLKLTADRESFQTDGREDVWLHVELLDKDGVGLANTTDVLLEVVEGDGIFPTGKSILLSPNTGSFLDGQGAIELKSWYGGKIVIKASAEGLEPMMVEVMAEGPERTKELVPMTPPPYLTPMPKMEFVYDTAICHPVFSSSSRENYEANHVTVDTSQSWIPVTNENEWVMVDLEGTLNIHCLEVITDEFAGDTLDVYLSTDWENFDKVEFGWKQDRYVYPNPCECRFIKVCWKPEMKAIVEVCAIVKGEM